MTSVVTALCVTDFFLYPMTDDIIKMNRAKGPGSNVSPLNRDSLWVRCFNRQFSQWFNIYEVDFSSLMLSGLHIFARR